MERALRFVALTFAMACTTIAYAQAPAAPADAPAGSTGLCKDGTYYSGATKKGACHGHKGVKQWWGSETSADKQAPAAAESKQAPAAADKSKPAAASEKSSAAPKTAAAPGAAPGDVWVNTESKVYHCAGDTWYGKTKEGEYMKESDAVAKGFRAAHGKSCK